MRGGDELKVEAGKILPQRRLQSRVVVNQQDTMHGLWRSHASKLSVVPIVPVTALLQHDLQLGALLGRQRIQHFFGEVVQYESVAAGEAFNETRKRRFHFVGHQANLRMLETLIEKVGIDDACLFICDFGNGSLGNFESTRYARGHKALDTFDLAADFPGGLEEALALLRIELLESFEGHGACSMG